MTNFNYSTLEANKEMILSEVNRTCRKTSRSRGMNLDQSSLESYLTVRLVEHVLKYDASVNSNFQAYVRQFLSRRVVDFFRSHTDVNSPLLHNGRNKMVYDYITGEVITKEEFNTRGLDPSLMQYSAKTVYQSANFSDLSHEDGEGSEISFEEEFNHASTSIEEGYEISSQLEAALSPLSERNRSIVLMTLENYSVNEIAATLGIGRNTINRTLKSEAVREAFLDAGYWI